MLRPQPAERISGEREVGGAWSRNSVIVVLIDSFFVPKLTVLLKLLSVTVSSYPLDILCRSFSHARMAFPFFFFSPYSRILAGDMITRVLKH